MLWRAGIEKDARRLKRRGGKNDDLCFDVIVLQRFVVDEVSAGGFAGGGIGSDFADDGVGADGEIAGVGGGIDEAGG